MKHIILALSTAALLGVSCLAGDDQQQVHHGVNMTLGKLIEAKPGKFLSAHSYIHENNVKSVLAKSEWKADLIPTCAAILKSSPNDDAKFAAIEFLARAQAWTPDALDPLFCALDDSSEKVRHCAVLSLDLTKVQVQKRLATYQDHKDSAVRLFASVAKVHLAGASDDELSVLLAALEHSDFCIRMEVFETLKQFPPQKRNPVPALLSALANPPYEFETVQIVHTLSQQGKWASEAVPDLMKFLDGKSAYVCIAACQALGKIGQPARPAVEGLRACLSHQNDMVRKAAAEALERIGG